MSVLEETPELVKIIALNFLDTFHPSLVEELTRAMTLHCIYTEEPEDELKQIATLTDAVDMELIDDANDMVVSSVESLLDDILNEHNIILNDDTPLRIKNDILEALYVVQALDNYMAIDGIVNSGDDNPTKLASIVEELVGTEQTTVSFYITDVEDSLIEALCELSNPKEEPVSLPVTYYNDIRVLAEADETELVVAVEYITAGIKPLMPVENYLTSSIDYYSSLIDNIIEDLLYSKQLASYFTSMAFLALGEEGNRFELAKTLLTNATLTAQQRLATENELNKLFERFSKIKEGKMNGSVSVPQ